MKKIALVSILSLALLVPGGLRAISESEVQDRAEMAQVWVDRHNAKLDPSIPQYVKSIRVRPHVYFIASRHPNFIPLKRLRLSQAEGLGVPSAMTTKSGLEVPLVSLRSSQAGGETFLTADYADERDSRHSTSDIYIKIGLQFRPLFHGNGYRGCARIVGLGKDNPAFFEVDTYGGGSRCDRTLYRLDLDALKGKSDELYDHPELIDVQKYVKKELELDVWLEGYTLYRDLNHDGSIEVINCTDVLYPEDLKSKVEERYKMVDNDFAGPFRRTTSIYKWNIEKSKFEDLGDYYH